MKFIKAGWRFMCHFRLNIHLNMTPIISTQHSLKSISKLKFKMNFKIKIMIQVDYFFYFRPPAIINNPLISINYI